MTGEHEYEYTKYLAWERDALNRLYYGLWILFMAGFVYSFHIPAVPHPCIVSWALAFFRVLAVVGTGVNFLMQYHALASLGHIRIMQLNKGQGNQCGADEERAQAQQSDRIVRRCEIPLHVIAATFLIEALVLSFLVYPPWRT